MQQIKTKLLPLIALLTGLLLAVSWPHTGGITPLIFIAWVPFLLVEQVIYTKRLRPSKVLYLSFPMFAVFNFLTTWWIYYATGGGMLMAVFVNALIMTITIWLFHLIHRRLGDLYGYIAFVVLWLAFEYCHYHWELAWPWLNLGNVFATRITWIQWYEYTGVGGGSLWILVVNLMVFFIVRYKLMKGAGYFSNVKRLAALLAAIILPLIVSFMIYSRYEEKKNPVDIVVVQPNIDPYNDKFGGMPFEVQMATFFREVGFVADSTIDFIIGPETALPYRLLENNLDKSEDFQYLMRVMQMIYPKTELLIGMSSAKAFTAKDEIPFTARKEGEFYYDYYNAALFTNASGTYDIYHKNKLVLGVEKVPFTSVFPFLEELALDMGGGSGSLGSQDHPTVFKSKFTQAQLAPIICYESVFGEHVTGFVNKGANLIAVMTNDGWWDNTPGHRQHLAYSSLRAIETRRCVTRSANTGVSAIINQRGEIIQRIEWWTPGAIRAKVNLNTDLTWYVRLGDLIYKLSFYMALTLLIVALIQFFRGVQAETRKEV